MEKLTVTVRSGFGTSDQIKEFQNMLNKKYNISGSYNSEDIENCKWILTGTIDNLKKVLKEVFNVWNDSCSCPILPNELLNEDDIKKLNY